MKKTDLGYNTKLCLEPVFFFFFTLKVAFFALKCMTVLSRKKNRAMLLKKKYLHEHTILNFCLEKNQNTQKDLTLKILLLLQNNYSNFKCFAFYLQ